VVTVIITLKNSDTNLATPTKPAERKRMTALQYSLPCLTSIILLSSTVSAFQVPCYKHPASITVLTDARQSSALSSPNPTVLSMSDWSDFSALDDEAEDDLLELKVDKRDYAVEEDS